MQHAHAYMHMYNLTGQMVGSPIWAKAHESPFNEDSSRGYWPFMEQPFGSFVCPWKCNSLLQMLNIFQKRIHGMFECII